MDLKEMQLTSLNISLEIQAQNVLSEQDQLRKDFVKYTKKILRATISKLTLLLISIKLFVAYFYSFQNNSIWY